ncbi:alpha/beta fold hydrolase [Nocardiopsis composta]
MLSGQANHHGWWDGVRGDFDAAFRTVAPDHRGTGSSGAPREAEYSIARFAADVAAVLDDLGVERAHVYGTSMGGKVAQRLAADHPDRVGALVLGCTSPAARTRSPPTPGSAARWAPWTGPPPGAPSST